MLNWSVFRSTPNSLKGPTIDTLLVTNDFNSVFIPRMYNAAAGHLYSLSGERSRQPPPPPKGGVNERMIISAWALEVQ